jgi:hypothetical protein
MNHSKKLIVVAMTILLALVITAVVGISKPSLAQEPQPVGSDGVSNGTGTNIIDAPPPSLTGTGVEGFTQTSVLPDEGPDLATSWLRIPGTVLKPRVSDVEWGVGGEGGGIYVTSGNRYEWFNTAVYLPQGSTVTTMRVYVKDTNASNNCQGYFTIYDLFGQIVHEYGAYSAGINGDDYFDVTVPSVVIDYGTYSYVVNWQSNSLTNDIVLYGFRLFYNPPPGFTYLPTIRK